MNPAQLKRSIALASTAASLVSLLACSGMGGGGGGGGGGFFSTDVGQSSANRETNAEGSTEEQGSGERERSASDISGSTTAYNPPLGGGFPDVIGSIGDGPHSDNFVLHKGRLEDICLLPSTNGKKTAKVKISGHLEGLKYPDGWGIRVIHSSVNTFLDTQKTHTANGYTGYFEFFIQTELPEPPALATLLWTQRKLQVTQTGGGAGGGDESTVVLDAPALPDSLFSSKHSFSLKFYWTPKDFNPPVVDVERPCQGNACTPNIKFFLDDFSWRFDEEALSAVYLSKTCGT